MIKIRKKTLEGVAVYSKLSEYITEKLESDDEDVDYNKEMLEGMRTYFSLRDYVDKLCHSKKEEPEKKEGDYKIEQCESPQDKEKNLYPWNRFSGDKK